ncbi:MAG: 8-oxo-dGTP diphosphatase MutT [Candidatus Competibacteraceae bacterium]|nr:8-oxo-dGTP diphosphatase MutT [Candidatus Competibacteraceae bacterium]
MKIIHVAVGILTNAAGEVLITRRPDHVHQGGLWEFPGGKVEEGEPAAAALSRELHEELGITVQAAEPWLHVRHDYPDKCVFLDVWRVVVWRGEPHGREGQPLTWALPAGLQKRAFPAADAPIITALTDTKPVK